MAAANAAEIKCINKIPRDNPWDRITHVGGYGTKPWKLTQEDAIGKIERNEWGFYVMQAGKRVDVVVAKSRFGNKYLKTTADGENPNNLLSLPECP